MKKWLSGSEFVSPDRRSWVSQATHHTAGTAVSAALGSLAIAMGVSGGNLGKVAAFYTDSLAKMTQLLARASDDAQEKSAQAAELQAELARLTKYNEQQAKQSFDQVTQQAESLRKLSAQMTEFLANQDRFNDALRELLAEVKAAVRDAKQRAGIAEPQTTEAAVYQTAESAVTDGDLSLGSIGSINVEDLVMQGREETDRLLKEMGTTLAELMSCTLSYCAKLESEKRTVEEVVVTAITENFEQQKRMLGQAVHQAEIFRDQAARYKSENTVWKARLVAVQRELEAQRARADRLQLDADTRSMTGELMGNLSPVGSPDREAPAAHRRTSTGDGVEMGADEWRRALQEENTRLKVDLQLATQRLAAAQERREREQDPLHAKILELQEQLAAAQQAAQQRVVTKPAVPPSQPAGRGTQRPATAVAGRRTGQVLRGRSQLPQ